MLSLRAFPSVLALAVALTLASQVGARADAPEAPAPARPGDAEVERHAALGQRLLEHGRTQDAIAEFRRAYELRADPRFLFDIAEGYRQLGLRDQARFFYQRYLAAAPDAPDREDVEAALAELGQPPARRAPSLTPSFAHDVVIVPVAPESPPLWRRWWVWAAFGAILAGGVTAVLLTREQNPSAPPTALGDKRFY